MATEVELRIIAKHQDAVKGVRELTNETENLGKSSQKFYTENEKYQKRQKGLIEDIEEAMESYKKSMREAMSTREIGYYNQKLKEAQRELKLYNEAGLEAKEKTESFMASVGRWALTLGGATAAFRILKEALLATTAGLNAFNIAGAVTKQVLYNLVTGASSLASGLKNVIEVQKKLNELRLKEIIDTFKAKEQQVLYNKYYFEASDRRKTDTERIELYNKALEAHNKMIEFEVVNVKEQLEATKKLLETQPGSEKLLQQYGALKVKLLELESESYSGVKRIQGAMTAMMQEELDKRAKDLQEYFDEIEKMNEEADKKAEKIYLEKLKRNDYIAKVGGNAWEGMTELDYETFEKGMQTLEKFKEIMNKLIPLNPDVVKRNKDQFDKIKSDEEQALEDRIKRYEMMKMVISELANVAKEITDREVENARRYREILDTRVAEAQRAMDDEIRLYEAGYASNVDAKRQEIESLKAARDKALKEEEEARKKQQRIDTITQISSLVTTSANILKGYSKMPIIGQILAIAAIGAMFAAFAAAKTRAKDSVKLTGGGHGTVTGRLHSDGGEAFLDHVEVENGESWGVLSRGSSRKYGKIFSKMVDSFNKDRLPLPKGAGINNVINLDTSSTNSRLERVEGQLIKLNNYFEGQEIVTDNGGASIMRKGNTVRIIRRR